MAYQNSGFFCTYLKRIIMGEGMEVVHADRASERHPAVHYQGETFYEIQVCSSLFIIQ